MSTIREIDFAHPPGFRPLSLDLRVPEAGGAPLVLFLHGGGWMRGSRRVFTPGIDDADSFDRIVAAGFAVAAAEYRLSGEARFPAQLEDVDSAIDWLRAHGDEYGVDASRIVLWGVSAGATLAALTGLRRDDVLGVVDWFGPTDLAAMAEHDTGEPPHATREARWLGATAAERPDIARAASPAFQVHAGAPPFHIAHGTADRFVPFSQSTALADALRAAGVPVELHPVAGGDHFWRGVDDTGPLFDRALDFASRPDMTAFTARFIAADEDYAGAPLLRGEFALDEGHGAVQSAVLLLSALGVCEAWVNGTPASDEVLTPGWTSYEWRLRYRELDVTALVAPTVVIGLALGNGWYRGRLGWDGDSRLYGDELAALAELRVRYADGHVQVVGTDAGWSSGPSATTANDLYDGQSIDARLRDDAWLDQGHSSGDWGGVHELDIDLAKLEPYVGPPVRRHEDVAPAEVWTSPSGRVLIDFGQNLVGWIRAEVSGRSGDVVTLRHAEVLEHDELGTRPLRSASATDRFTLSGGDDVFEPTLTFHGFRYAEVDGWPGGAEALAARGGLTAVVVSSDLRRIGHFACSDAMLNRLHENTVWGMRGNFLDVPTDCPQRDERLGWTGDLAAFAPTAAFLYDTQAFLRDWLRDLALEQEHADGVVPIVVPDVVKYFTLPEGMPRPGPTAVWGDAAAWVPWALWVAYGDRRVLEDQFDSMAAHARAIERMLAPSGVWNTGFQFGDWLDPDAPPDDPGGSKADPHVVATICAFRTATIVAETAGILGDDDARREFTALAARLRAGFLSEYLHDGVIESDCTTVYSLAVVFGILDDPGTLAAGARLADLVAEGGHLISTGFAGTPFILDALTATGHLDTAYRLLMQTECPSWLYPVTMGATTIWERWDSMLPDGSINPGGMTSFNHYAFGAVADWMHRTIAGLAPLEPGYRRMLVSPRPGGGVTWARADLETPHGTAAVRWEQEGTMLRTVVTVPGGTQAVLRLPGRTDEILEPGVHERVTEGDR